MITEKKLQQEIRNVPDGARREILVDDNLVLDVLKSGKCVWRFRYTENGAGKKLKLGDYPLMSMKEARLKRDEARLKLASGESPMSERKKGLTLSEAFESWMQKKIEPSSTPKYIYNTRLRMKPLLKKYGGKPVARVTSADILEVVEDIERDEKYDHAHRVRQLTSQLYRFCIASGLAASDPAYALTGALHARTVKHLPRITDPDRVGQLMRDIRDKGRSPLMRALLQLHAYTFVRPQNIREAEWSEFDVVRALWTIPAAKMKMRRLHIVPLSRQVIALLEDLRVMTGHGRYLFPAATSWSGDRHISDGAENKALRERGYSKDVMVGHGFRGMASTLLHSNGFNSRVIEVQLAHVDSDSVRDAYNDADYMEQRRAMMQWYADYLDSLRDGTPTPSKP